MGGHMLTISRLLLCSALLAPVGCRTTAPSSSAVKDVQSIAAVSAATGIPAWNAQLEANGISAGIDLQVEGHSECAAVNEIQGAYLCASVHLKHANLALARASIFVEGLFDTPKGTVVKLSSSAYLQGVSDIGGHDLTSDDLATFWQALSQACSSSQSADICPTPREKEMFNDFILPKIATSEKFVIISYALHSIIDWPEVVTHEILHAQYFLQPDFRATADHFWTTKVLPDTQSMNEIKDALAPYYNVDDEFLLKNEFQAYILMANAENNVLSEVVQKFRQPLMTAMQNHGVQPLQVQDGSAPGP